MNIALSARDILDAAAMLQNTSITMLELPASTMNALINSDIVTLAQLARVEVERVIGVGLVGEAHIRNAMRRRGFTLEVGTLGLTVAQEDAVERSAA